MAYRLPSFTVNTNSPSFTMNTNSPSFAPSPSASPSFAPPSASPSFAPPPSGFSGASSSTDPNLFTAEQLIQQLLDPELRENALHILSKKREHFSNLAPLLWHSSCTATILLQEIITAYGAVLTQTMTTQHSNRICNALALLQCIASHPETRPLFMKAEIPSFLYPFLRTTSNARPFEFLRLTTLGVIGALIKVDDTEVITSLLESEIFPLCLRAMEQGSELSKTVATFIVMKILQDDLGLYYICSKTDRFFALVKIMGVMVASLVEEPSPRLLKHIVRCYLRLTDHPRACDALGNCLPDLLRNKIFISCLYEDPHALQGLKTLLHNVSIGGVAVHGFEPKF